MKTFYRKPEIGEYFFRLIKWSMIALVLDRCRLAASQSAMLSNSKAPLDVYI